MSCWAGEAACEGMALFSRCSTVTAVSVTTAPKPIPQPYKKHEKPKLRHISPQIEQHRSQHPATGTEQGISVFCRLLDQHFVNPFISPFNLVSKFLILKNTCYTSAPTSAHSNSLVVTTHKIYFASQAHHQWILKAL